MKLLLIRKEKRQSMKNRQKKLNQNLLKKRNEIIADNQVERVKYQAILFYQKRQIVQCM